MPTDSNGNHTLPSGTTVNLGDTLLPSQHNPAMQDISAGLTARFMRNGTSPMTADMPFGGFKGVNLAAGTANTDAVRFGQITEAFQGRIATIQEFDSSAGTGSDDTDALQEALDSDASVLMFNGDFKTSAVLEINTSKPKVILSSGSQNSSITTSHATEDIISKDGTGSFICQGMRLLTSTNRSGGAAIRIKGGGAMDLVANNQIAGSGSSIGMYDGVVVESSLLPIIQQNYILSCRGVAIDLASTAGGEGLVFGNTLNTALSVITNAVGLRFRSGAGLLHVLANRIQTYPTGFYYNPADGYTTLSLIAAGNTFENNITGSMALALPSSGTALMQDALVFGNRCINPNGGYFFQTSGSTNTDWIDRINLYGNNILFNANYPVNIQAGAIFTEFGNIYQSLTTGLTAILTAGSMPTSGHIGSPPKNFVPPSGGSITPYNINANPNITKFSVTAA